MSSEIPFRQPHYAKRAAANEYAVNTDYECMEEIRCDAKNDHCEDTAESTELQKIIGLAPEHTIARQRIFLCRSKFSFG